MIFLNRFPRSGHHMLVETASALFPSLSYCEKYRCEDQWNEGIDCSGRNIPIPLKTICRAGKRIQKSHDFDLSDLLLTGNDVKYLILMRNPVPSIISWWKITLNEQPSWDDTGTAFQNFFVNKFAFWNDFGRKWLLPAVPIMDKTADTKVVFATYEQLTGNPDVLRAAVQYLIPERSAFLCDVHSHVLAKAVRKPVNRISSYKHYDRGFFEEVTSTVDPKLAKCIEVAF